MAQMIKTGMTNKQVHAMKKKTEPGTMGNDSLHMPKRKAKAMPWSAKADESYDKAHGIKPGSKRDNALDAKRGLMRKKTSAKVKAKKLTSDERNALPKDAFVFPGQRRYPINDENHARNALARAAGKPEEAQVRAAVHKKFPNIK